LYNYIAMHGEKKQSNVFRSEETKIWSSAPKEFQYQDGRTDGLEVRRNMIRPWSLRLCLRAQNAFYLDEP